MKCTSNVALKKPTKASQLVVDGKFLPQESRYFCQEIDMSNTMVGIDLQESIPILAVNISLHPEGGHGFSVEVGLPMEKT